MSNRATSLVARGGLMVQRRNGREHVRVFVGTSANGEDAEACAVLEHTLRANSSLPVDVEWMRLSRDRASPYFCDPQAGEGWRTEQWSTPWTALRWAVPALCHWRGRAVYMDCANIVLGDAAALWNSNFPDGACVLARQFGPQLLTGVMVWDCARAQKWMDDGPYLAGDPVAHQHVGYRLLTQGRGLVGPLPSGWGVMDAEYSRDPSTATGSVHCANLHLQPHQRPARERLRAAGREHWFGGPRLPHYCPGLVELFRSRLGDARAAGYDPEQYVPDEAYGAYAISGAVPADARRR